MKKHPLPRPLTRVESIVQNISQAIESGQLPPGTRLPSIRQQAVNFGVSPFTITDAYDRLVAQGQLFARQGAGFFVHKADAQPVAAGAVLGDLPIDEHWLLRNVYVEHGQNSRIPVGCGWLPGNWYDLNAQQRALRSIAREGFVSAEYGHPQGFAPLRQLLTRQLAQRQIHLNQDGLLLTQGASSALNIAAATVTRPGDTVLVDDPGYCNLLSSLTFNGIKLIGVPWTAQGPDIGALEQLARQHQPRAYFTNPWLQNPTGASYNPSIAHQVLRLAEQYDFVLVEDDASADLTDDRQATLAALDGLRHVIYIGSLSKSLSPGLRVGYIAANGSQLDQMVRYKMMTGLTSPEINERMVFEMLKDSRQRKQLERLRSRLAEAQYSVAQQFESIGWELFTKPQNGLFLLAKPGSGMDSLKMAHEALQHNILLAPGKLFRPYGTASPWLRFNVGFCQNEALWALLKSFNDRKA
jgi:DNA-binding transcriptional MocR family regulator